MGLHWRPVASWSFALAYSTEQAFEDFELDSRVAHPDLPDFGAARELELALDERLAIDVTYWHGSENEVSAPFRTPAGPIPGTEVTVSNQASGLSATLGFRF